MIILVKLHITEEEIVFQSFVKKYVILEIICLIHQQRPILPLSNDQLESYYNTHKCFICQQGFIYDESNKNYKKF